MFELSLIVGVLLLATGLGALFNKKYMQKALREGLSSSSFVVGMAILNLLIGLSVLSVTYEVTVDLPGLLSLAGWIFFLRGVLLMWFPIQIATFAKKQLKNNDILMFGGMIAVLYGGALTYFAWGLM